MELIPETDAPHVPFDERNFDTQLTRFSRQFVEIRLSDIDTGDLDPHFGQRQ
jgi:hypothetical protein